MAYSQIETRGQFVRLLGLGASGLIPVYHRLMKCSMCPKPIPEPRRLVVPSTVTCSPECSRQRKLWLSREGAKRQRQRIKAANAAKREAAANAAEREATEQKA